MRVWRRLILLTFLLFCVPSLVFAEEKNNKFGIHLARPEESAIKKAAELVNSSGGKWGYVTLVMQENELDKAYWQNVFDTLRRYKLIPIIRLATRPDGGVWRKPEKEQAEKWAEFLNSLNWVVKTRYVILFNEPNHASEWGGRVDPEDYAEVSLSFAKALKEKNKNFFVMLAGFDASAPQKPPQFMDETVFLRRFLKHFGRENFEKFIDGWASHSYPNPHFSASPFKRGRESITTYKWEISFLKSLGIKKELPVFITETGWDRDVVGEEKQAEYLKKAFEFWLSDPQVIAVTPFILDYKTYPFEKFSFLKSDGSSYKIFEIIKNMPKTAGEPEVEEKVVLKASVGLKLVSLSNYTFQIILENQGQAIWSEKEGYRFALEPEPKGFEVSFSKIEELVPFEQGIYYMQVSTKDKLTKGKYKLVLRKGDKVILKTSEWPVEILPLPSLNFSLRLFPKFKADASDYEIQIFDSKESLVFKKKNVNIKDGKGRIERIKNVELGQRYRVVVLKPYYLPRQNFVVFKGEEASVSFRSLLPLDFDLDGNFDLRDFWFLIKSPKNFKYFLPI